MLENLTRKERIKKFKLALKTKPKYPAIVVSNAADRARYGYSVSTDNGPAALLHISDFWGYPTDDAKYAIGVTYDGAVTRCGLLMTDFDQKRAGDAIGAKSPENSQEAIEALLGDQYRLCEKCGQKSEFIAVLAEGKAVIEAIYAKHAAQRQAEQEEKARWQARMTEALEELKETFALLEMIDSTVEGFAEIDPENRRARFLTTLGTLTFKILDFDEDKKAG